AHLGIQADDPDRRGSRHEPRTAGEHRASACRQERREYAAEKRQAEQDNHAHGRVTLTAGSCYTGISETGIPSAFATPAPYAGSAFPQLMMWRSLISFGASPIARAVFSNSTVCCAGLISRNSARG